ncbi:MAG: hypothetical protein M1826_003570 [Phylliscum demangeonii]|nr:MAG: hypothetical protein M1826_003570 [Phylliscum demangeonii]
MDLVSSVDKIRSAAKAILVDPKNGGLLAVIKAARNGAVYGTKIRFPHAVVMIFLFRHGSLKDKLRLILRATGQHARNLAVYAALYKLTMYALNVLRAPPKELRSDSFVAGLLGGYVVFGRGHQSSVNQQISIYVFARVVLAYAHLAVQQGGIMPDPDGAFSRNTWPVFAALSWAAVMYLFRWHPDTLQPSLRSSMKYIYQNADHWDSFRNFLLFNQ